MVSGGFDPLHIGHLSLFKDIIKFGNIIVVALNSDEWLIKKKGYVFMSWKERKGILEALEMISWVISVDDEDGTVCKALESLKPEYFCNGGDRINGQPMESSVCQKLRIREVFGVGGTSKIQSSTALVKAVR